MGVEQDSEMWNRGRMLNENVLEKDCGVGYHVHQGDGEIYAVSYTHLYSMLTDATSDSPCTKVPFTSGILLAKYSGISFCGVIG